MCCCDELSPHVSFLKSINIFDNYYLRQISVNIFLIFLIFNSSANVPYKDMQCNLCGSKICILRQSNPKYSRDFQNSRESPETTVKSLRIDHQSDLVRLKQKYK